MTKPAPEPRNGVPVQKLFATIDKVRQNPEIAAFRFTAKNRWLEGTASRSTIHEWSGGGGDHVHVQAFSFDADHPTLGNGYGPTPQEYLLHGLAACITAGIATTAAARKIDLTTIESTVEGDLDVQGVLGLDDAIRNGFSQIRMSIRVRGDADEETLKKLVDASRARSAVYDILTNETPVVIEASAAPARLREAS
jgi:uncharacterized OsmC-like protein